MRKSFILGSVLILSFLFSINIANAQVSKTIELCKKHLTPPYISDGQEYRTLLSGEEIAEFHATFYGGSTYRIVANSGIEEGNLKFSLYDKERNLLYSNVDYEYTPYWDFKFNSTIDCIIEAELNNEKVTSGYVMMLIGFKQQ